MTQSNRVAVVTGGSSGVGRATVRELADRGWDVAVLARDNEGLHNAAQEVVDRGRRGLAVPVDVANAAEVEFAADRVEDELGPIDAWVNVAFTGSICFVEELTAEEFQRITDVTYLGFVHGTRAALRRMRPRDRGVIVQTSSALGYRGIPLQSAYCGAKHATIGFTESVRTELMHHGSKVQICMVALPGVNTPQFDQVLDKGIAHHPQPVPPIYQPEVAGRAIAHMVEHPRRTMFVGAPTWGTVVGNRLAPWLLDRYLARTNVSAQQDARYDPPSPVSNTWHPLQGDAGAHGAFDDKAWSASPVTWVAMHRLVSTAAAVATAAVGGTVWRAARGASA